VAGGLAELLRNLGLISFSTAFVEPLFTGGQTSSERIWAGAFWGLLFVAMSVIVDHERRE
jgi:hypothetical protein